MITHLFDAPAVTNTQFKSTTGNHIQAGHLFGQPDRIALRNKSNTRTQTNFLSHGGTGGESDKLIVCTPIHFRKRWRTLSATPRRLPADRDVTVFGKPQRLESAGFDFLCKLNRLNRLVSWKDHDPNFHDMPPFALCN